MSEYNHDKFKEWAIRAVNSDLAKIIVIATLAEESLTIAELTDKVNEWEALTRKQSINDIKAIISKNEEMGYVKKERNIKRYKNFSAYYELTEKGQEWAEHIPEVLEEKRKRIHDAREKVLALCRN